MTSELVAEALRRFPPGTVGPVSQGRRFAVEADFDTMLNSIMRGAPPGDLWVFAYGSLIWNPGFDFVERKPGLARGWSRAFRLGYDIWFRGSVERPGLMLVLDRGGACWGMLHRLDRANAVDSLNKLVRREFRFAPHPFPPRWIKVETEGRALSAMTFAMDRKAPAYVPNVPRPELVRILATASGPMGSMADYLFSTVTHLEQSGIHDGMLWELQEQVAEYLENN